MLLTVLAGCHGAGGSGDAGARSRPSDADGDGIADLEEGAFEGTDTDRDGVPDYLDEDSDGDGYADRVEGTADPDLDGLPNYRDLDSDRDGVPDADEPAEDHDGDGLLDPHDLDDDDDRIPDYEERGDGGEVPDHDGDGEPDHRDPDSDDDTILDGDEGSWRADTDDDGALNRFDPDADGDGFSDAEEAGDDDLWTLPLDTDFDEVPDFLDLDSDDDDLPDADERTRGTHRLLADTDRDGEPDGVEAQVGTDPTDAADRPPFDTPVFPMDRGATPTPRVLRVTLPDDAPSAARVHLVVEAIDPEAAGWLDAGQATPAADPRCAARAVTSVVTADDGYLDAAAGDTLCWRLAPSPNLELDGVPSGPRFFQSRLTVVVEGGAPREGRALFRLPAMEVAIGP